MMKKILFFTSFVLFFTSCGEENLDTKVKSVKSQEATQTNSCICTMHYKPVCGSNDETYSNSCMANCNGVTDYTEGECACQNSEAVCGGPPMPECPKGQLCTQAMPRPKVYKNECELKKAGANPLPLDACEMEITR